MDPNDSMMVIATLGLMRDCLCAVLGELTELEVLGVNDEFELAMNSVATLLPRILLVSTCVQGFSLTDFIRRIKRNWPTIRVLAMISNRKEDWVADTSRAGADGYILNTATPKDISSAISCTLRGETFNTLDQSVSVLPRDLALMKTRLLAAEKQNTLTRREREVLVLVASGRKNKAIATHLGLSVNTVEKHRSSLMRKIGTHNAAGVTAYAIGKGLISENYAALFVKDHPVMH